MKSGNFRWKEGKANFSGIQNIRAVAVTNKGLTISSVVILIVMSWEPLTCERVGSCVQPEISRFGHFMAFDQRGGR